MLAGSVSSVRGAAAGARPAAHRSLRRRCPRARADVWDAENYGQTVYAIRTRNGQVYLRLQKNYGDMSALEVSGCPAGWLLAGRCGEGGRGPLQVRSRLPARPGAREGRGRAGTRRACPASCQARWPPALTGPGLP